MNPMETNGDHVCAPRSGHRRPTSASARRDPTSIQSHGHIETLRRRRRHGHGAATVSGIARPTRMMTEPTGAVIVRFSTRLQRAGSGQKIAGRGSRLIN
jgi:hypothetical protein